MYINTSFFPEYPMLAVFYPRPLYIAQTAFYTAVVKFQDSPGTAAKKYLRWRIPPLLTIL